MNYLKRRLQTAIEWSVNTAIEAKFKEIEAELDQVLKSVDDSNKEIARRLSFLSQQLREKSDDTHAHVLEISSQLTDQYRLVIKNVSELDRRLNSDSK